MGIDAVMVVVIPKTLTDEELRTANWKLFCLFGPEPFIFDKHYDAPLERAGGWVVHAIPKQENEATLIRVHLWSRYYGPGYERGDASLICNLGEALESYIFDRGMRCSVYYGGDCGDRLDLFDSTARSELKKHWFENANRPYARSFGSAFRDNLEDRLCRRCGVGMRRYGWGPKFGSWRCECGDEILIRNDVMTYTTDRERRMTPVEN